LPPPPSGASDDDVDWKRPPNAERPMLRNDVADARPPSAPVSSASPPRLNSLWPR